MKLQSEDKRRRHQLLRLLAKRKRGEAGIDECEFLERAPVIERFVTWGILNPFGPTVISLCLAGAANEKQWIVFTKLSNPFSQDTTAYGAIPADGDKQATIQGVLNATMPAHKGAPLLIGGLPSIVIPASGKGRVDESGSFAVICRDLTASRDPDNDLASAITSLKQFWLKPWDRIPSFANILSDVLSGGKKPKTRNSKKSITEWWQVVTHADHVLSEWEAIREAWDGSIGFAAGLPAVSELQGLAFHRQLINKEYA